MKKRMFAALLCLCMLATLFPTAVFAETAPTRPLQNNASTQSRSTTLGDLQTRAINLMNAGATINLALEATAKASTEHPGNNGAYHADKLNDGNTVTRWSATDEDLPPVWVQLDWTSSIKFDVLKLTEPFPGRAINVKIYASNDENAGTMSNDAWKALSPFYILNSINGSIEIVLPEVMTARSVRISMERKGDSTKQPGLSEVEVYNRFSDDATIHNFSVNGITADIDHEKGQITLTLDDGTQLTNVAPLIAVSSGATYSPKGSVDLSNASDPVIFTVMAKDGETRKEYIVRVKQSSLISHCDLNSANVEHIIAFGPTPSPNQYRYQKDELAAFLHFGINTFNGAEWTTSKQDLSIFTLDKKVDADNYVKLLKEAGFKRLIVVAKHHDGFLLFKSNWSDYGVASTNYPGGDVLEDLSAACTKYDMDMGLYLSPWDATSEYYGYYDTNGNPTSKENDVLDYNDYYDGQLVEILGNPKYGNNGRFVEIWMDGAKGTGANAQDYDFDRWISTIQRLQGKAAGRDDDVLMFGADKYSTVRWIGNELGCANEENWSKALAAYGQEDGAILSLTMNPWSSVSGLGTGFKHGNKWIVPEADARITSGWFWGPNKNKPKAVGDLFDNMYLKSVGRNATLLLNIPLNRYGTLDAAIVNRTREFGDALKQTFESNLAMGAKVSAFATDVREMNVKFSPINACDGDPQTYWAASNGEKTASLQLEFGEEITFDVVAIEEAIQYGQRIESFTIFYRNPDGQWIEFGNGSTIGAKRIVIDYPVRATAVKVEFTGMTGTDGTIASPAISEVGVYKSSVSVQKSSGAPRGLREIDSISDKVTKGFWNVVENRASVGGSYLRGDSNSGELKMKFHGTYAIIRGGSTNADFTVKVDEGESVALHGANPMDAYMYETPTLSDGEHTLIIEVLSGEVFFDALYALNNGGKGLLDFEYNDYTLDEALTFDIKVLRKGGTTGKICAIIQDNPGTAVQYHYQVTNGILVEFANEENEKTVSIRTLRVPEKTGELSFSLDIVHGSDERGLIVGVNATASIRIQDAESIYSGGYLKRIEAADNQVLEIGQSVESMELSIAGIYQKLSIPLCSGTGIGRAKDIVLDTPVTARSLRIILESLSEPGLENPCLQEIEVYNRSAGNINLALSATATAVSSHRSGRFPPSMVNNGNVSTNESNRWVPADDQPFPMWLQLEWDTDVTFDRIVIYEWKDGRNKYRTGSFSIVAIKEEERMLTPDQYTLSPAEFDRAGEYQVTVTEKIDLKSTTFTASVIDRRELTELYDKLTDSVQGNLSDEIWIPFENARRNAAEIIATHAKNLQQSEIDAALNALRSAVAAFPPEALGTATLVYSGTGIGRARDIMLDTPVTARSLIIILESLSEPGLENPCLQEIEVYNRSAGNINLAFSATATAVSSHRSGRFPPSMVNNGNVSTSESNRWVPADDQPFPIWLQLEWDTDVTFDRIVIYEWKDGRNKYRTGSFSIKMIQSS